MTRAQGAAAALVLPILLLMAAPALAHQSGQMKLKGKVAVDCRLNVASQEAPLNITDGTTDLTVAHLSEFCNKSSGFTLRISSANAGSLLGPKGTRVAYTITYDTVSARRLTAPLVLARYKPKVDAAPLALKVSVPATPKALGGDFKDTLTLTIAAR